MADHIEAMIAAVEWCPDSYRGPHRRCVMDTCSGDEHRKHDADCPITLAREQAAHGRTALAKMERLTTLRPRDEWHEDDGAVLWWTVPIEQPPYCGTPLDGDWPWGESDRVKYLRITTGDTEVYRIMWSPLPEVKEASDDE